MSEGLVETDYKLKLKSFKISILENRHWTLQKKNIADSKLLWM